MVRYDPRAARWPGDPVDVATPGHLAYTRVEPYAVAVRDRAFVVFTVRADNDAHIALSAVASIKPEQSYEVQTEEGRTDRQAVFFLPQFVLIIVIIFCISFFLFSFNFFFSQLTTKA